MLNWFFLLPYLLGVLFVILVMVVQSRFRRTTSKRIPFKGDHILGYYVGLMSSLSGITLAFILSAAWNNHEQTREVTNQEAQVLGSIAFFGRGLPDPLGSKVVQQVQQYAQTAIDDEWPSLARGVYSLKLNQESARLGLTILRYQPSNANNAALRQQLLTAFAQLRVLRGERRLKARYQIPAEIWIFMLFAAFCILISCVMLEIEHQRFHLLQTGLIATFLTLAVVITWDLQTPFEGFSNVTDTPFSRLMDDSFVNESAWQNLSS
ncbi:DUF4239 domain-containing protein [bacterium]|nr:MAG: DUF4239 domain-containing protein [bacterium]